LRFDLGWRYLPIVGRNIQCFTIKMIQPQFVKAVACGLTIWLGAALSLAHAQEPRREITRIAGDLYRFRNACFAKRWLNSILSQRSSRPVNVGVGKIPERQAFDRNKSHYSVFLVTPAGLSRRTTKGECGHC
jgi:hypothetical protein